MTTPTITAPDTAAVIARHRDMVYALCLTHTRSRTNADDVFQEVFLTYHRKQPVCRDGEHRRAWLIRTTLMIARRVATSSWQTRVDLGAEDRAGGDAFRFDVVEYDDLFRALQRLPEAYRSVIHLFYFEDLPVGQIAALLGDRPGAVKTRLSRGRDMLRAAMKEDCHVQ
ncbi:MAG: sigma-70 family RNA polymerase sigma factor [Actinomycetia bacterium]|nr:sigma-70 family RNA polymerase sigma factor [Actinomycetes bacterium]